MLTTGDRRGTWRRGGCSGRESSAHYATAPRSGLPLLVSCVDPGAMPCAERSCCPGTDTAVASGPRVVHAALPQRRARPSTDAARPSTGVTSLSTEVAGPSTKVAGLSIEVISLPIDLVRLPGTGACLPGQGARPSIGLAPPHGNLLMALVNMLYGHRNPSSTQRNLLWADRSLPYAYELLSRYPEDLPRLRGALGPGDVCLAWGRATAMHDPAERSLAFTRDPSLRHAWVKSLPLCLLAPTHPRWYI